MTEEKIGNLEEEALKRKERLKALKRKHTDSDPTNSTLNQEPIQLPKYVLFS